MLFFLLACRQETTREVVDTIYLGDTAAPADGDFDGFTDDDCDPDNGIVNPEATDLAGDGVDENCDGLDGTDADADGVASTASGGTDCDDADANAAPGMPDDEGDEIDQDCDGKDGAGLPAFRGDITIGSDDDAAWFCSEYSAIQGQLTVTGDLAADALGCITSVSGDISLAISSDAIEFTSLKSIGGNFVAINNYLTSDYVFPSLATMGGGMAIYGYSATALHTIDLPMVTQMGGITTYMDSQGALFNAPMLETVTGSFSVHGTFVDVESGEVPEPGLLVADSLAHVGEAFSFTDTGYWGDSPMVASFPELTDAEYIIVGTLEDIEFPKLTTLTVGLNIYYTGIVSTPALIASGNGIALYGPGGLSAPLLQTTPMIYATSYPYYGTLGPATLDFPSLTSADSLTLSATGLTNLDGFSALTTVSGDLWMNDNYSLSDISGLSDLESVGAFSAYYNSPVTDDDFYSLLSAITAGSVTVEGNG